MQNTNTEPIERDGAATMEKIRSTIALIIRMAGELEDPVSRLLDHAATPWEDERAACLCRIHDHLHPAFFPLGQSGSLLHNELDWWAMEPGDELKGNAPYEILPTAEDPATRWRVATPAEVIATPAAPNSRSSSNCVNSPPRSVR